MKWRGSCLLACWLSLAAQAGAIDPGKDPVPSVMWAFYQQQFLGNAPFVFDERVKLLAPPFAEDARQVPLEIDARAFKGEVVRILAWAELNPLPKIVDFQPLDSVLPWLSLRIRIEPIEPRAVHSASRVVVRGRRDLAAVAIGDTRGFCSGVGGL